MVGSWGVPNHVSGGAVGGADAEAADAVAELALGFAVERAVVSASPLALGAGELVATTEGEGEGGGADSCTSHASQPAPSTTHPTRRIRTFSELGTA
jgi:hypothetical protein